MSAYATLRELQQNAAAVLETARQQQNGMTLLTSRGKPVALLVPVTAESADELAQAWQRLRFAAALRAAQTALAQTPPARRRAVSAARLIATTRRARRA